jgi:hypothetical protein
VTPEIRRDHPELLAERADVLIEESRIDRATVQEHERLAVALLVVPDASTHQIDISRHASPS